MAKRKIASPAERTERVRRNTDMLKRGNRADRAAYKNLGAAPRTQARKAEGEKSRPDGVRTADLTPQS